MSSVKIPNKEQFNQEDLEKYLVDLEYIVNIDSPSYHKEGIKLIQEFFEEKADKLGLKVTRKLYNQEAGPCMLISNIDIDHTEDIDFLLLAHLDTVFEVGIAKERSFVVKPNGFAYGPGVVDNKAGALLGLYLLEKIDLSYCKVVLLLNSNEETGSQGNSELITEIAKKTKYTLVLEPTREDGSFVDSRYGTVNYKIDFTGAKSKTGDFTEGSSALLEAANFIKLVNISNPWNKNIMMNFTIKTEPVQHLGEIVDNLTLGMQVRYLTVDSISKVQNKIDFALSHKLVDKVKIDIHELKKHPGLFRTKESDILKRYIWIAGKKQDYAVKWTSSLGGSDGCFAALSGRAVLDGLGPMGGKFHTKEEYLDINHVRKISNILIDTINSISEANKRK